MERKEKQHYDILTPFQKDVVEALKKIGFEHQYFSTWLRRKGGYWAIDVSRINNLEDLISGVLKDGKHQKLMEIHSVFEIPSPRI